MNTAITTVVAKFSTHSLLCHYFSREAMAKYIIVDDIDSVNKFSLLRGRAGWGQGIMCTLTALPRDDSGSVFMTGLWYLGHG